MSTIVLSFIPIPHPVYELPSPQPSKYYRLHFIVLEVSSENPFAYKKYLSRYMFGENFILIALPVKEQQPTEIFPRRRKNDSRPL